MSKTKDYSKPFTEAELRNPNNFAYLDFVLTHGEALTNQRIGEPVSCPCIRMLLVERFSSEELKAFLKISYALAQISVDTIASFCPAHDDAEVISMEQHNAAFLLSTIEHIKIEIARRETEFNTEGD